MKSEKKNRELLDKMILLAEEIKLKTGEIKSITEFLKTAEEQIEKQEARAKET